MKTTQAAEIIDCLDGMKKLPDKSIDCAILDPPYYKVVTAGWDNQWKTLGDYINWLEVRVLEVKRVLKNNGSLYIFGDDQVIAYVQVMMDKHFSFLNHLIWYKRNNQSIKGAENSRRFACVSERILFYEQNNSAGLPATGLEMVMHDVTHFVPLRQYFKDFQEALGLSLKQINTIFGNREAEHAFYWNSTQWLLPTKETYLKLCKLPLKSEFLRRDYEDLRRDYEDLRRVFHPSYKQYEIIDIPIINSTENTSHRTTKPLALIKMLLKASTNEGMTVLDTFAGSWTTSEVCMCLNLNCVSFDISDEWLPDYHRRLKTNLMKLDNFL